MDYNGLITHPQGEVSFFQFQMTQEAQSYALVLTELGRLSGQHGQFVGLWISPVNSLSPTRVILNRPASHLGGQQQYIQSPLAIETQNCSRSVMQEHYRLMQTSPAWRLGTQFTFMCTYLSQNRLIDWQIHISGCSSEIQNHFSLHLQKGESNNYH